MPPDASDTKRRILAAARAEFAAHGFAGARVDRIAEHAQANKRSIYVHFGAKEQLFDLVIAQALAELEAGVPFTPNDLPGYAGATFDFLVATPAFARINIWSLLERTEPTAVEGASYGRKVEALRAAGVRDPVDTLALVMGLATSWLATSPALRALAPGDPMSPKRLAEYREQIVSAVAAVVNRKP
jgi:AcrR family transcriptional regulator